MKAKVHWIVTGEIEIPDDLPVKHFMDILDFVPPANAPIIKNWQEEVELVEILDSEGTARISFDFAPADIRLYERRDK